MSEGLKRLWADSRSFGQRLGTAALMGFAIPFTFVIVGILELFMNNIGLFPFDISTLIGPTLLTGLLGFLVLTAVGCLLRDIFWISFMLGGRILAGRIPAGQLSQHPFGRIDRATSSTGASTPATAF